MPICFVFPLAFFWASPSSLKPAYPAVYLLGGAKPVKKHRSRQAGVSRKATHNGVLFAKQRRSSTYNICFSILVLVHSNVMCDVLLS